jgi:hypothetical protein
MLLGRLRRHSSGGMAVDRGGVDTAAKSSTCLSTLEMSRR